MYFQIACGGFGGLQQIIQQFFQLSGLAQQYFRILRQTLFLFGIRLRRQTILCCCILFHFLPDEIRIINNGSQWCLNVMGDIGNELRL